MGKKKCSLEQTDLGSDLNNCQVCDLKHFTKVLCAPPCLSLKIIILTILVFMRIRNSMYKTTTTVSEHNACSIEVVLFIILWYLLDDSNQLDDSK